MILSISKEKKRESKEKGNIHRLFETRLDLRIYSFVHTYLRTREPLSQAMKFENKFLHCFFFFFGFLLDDNRQQQHRQSASKDTIF